MAEAAQGIAQDVRELQRGVLVTYLGYALKLGLPVLIALSTRVYGAKSWGLFISAQAVLLILLRVCLFGLDKALLWAIPGRPASDALLGLRPALLRVGLHATLVCLGLQLFWQRLPAAIEAEYGALPIAAWGLLPFALSELLLHATMGLRRLELQVAVRETLNPVLQTAASLLFFQLGMVRDGLAWGFVVSHWVGLLVACLGFRRLFPGSASAPGPRFRLPGPLVAYAWPAWLAEIGNSALLRLDTVVLAALTDPTVVGVWGVIAHFGNALRHMRRAYDPVVTAIMARIAVQRDARRLAEAFSYAAQMVSLTQLPVFAALVCFGDRVLPLYGPEFAAGARAMSLLAGFLLLSGGTGLSGLVISGFGRSGWMLVNVLLTMGLQLALLLWLVPRYGLEGAAVAVGGSVCVVNLIQLLEMKLVTGSFNFTRRSRFSLGVLVGSGAGTLMASLLARLLALDPLASRALAMLGFTLSYLTLCAYGLREGVLRAPAEPAAPSELVALAS